MAVDNNRGPTIGLWNIIASSLILIMSSSAYLLVEEVKICHENFGPLKILVWGAKIFGTLVLPGLKLSKILVRLRKNGPPTFIKINS